MTKSSLHHDRDGIAIDALRRQFPSYWIYKSPSNLFGNKEYSEDLIIEIVNSDENHTVSGVEFGVQNKTNPRIGKHHVSVELQSADIMRLMNLQRPILIHGYDIETTTSYWLWLNEWYLSNKNKLKRKGSITLKIPKKSVLDKRNVTHIEQYARWEHQKRKIQERAGMVARQYSSDYKVNVVMDVEGITLVFDPKHQGAIPIIHALDQSSSEAIIRAIETGETVPLVGSFAFSNLPELLGEEISKTLESASLTPYFPKDTNSVVKIEFFDNTSNLVFKSPFVELDLVQSGTIIKRFEGVDNALGITYSFTFDFREERALYTIHLQEPTLSARKLAEYFDRFNRFCAVTKIRITHLKTEEVIEAESDNLFNRKLSLQQELWQRMAAALVTIEDRLNVIINMPDTIDSGLVARAEWVAEVLRDGVVKVENVDFIPNNAVLICNDSAYLARDILSAFEQDGQISITVMSSGNQIEVELLNQKLQLGLARYAFSNTKIINIGELQKALEQAKDDTLIQTVFVIDRNEVYLRFDEWSPSLIQSDLNRDHIDT